LASSLRIQKFRSRRLDFEWYTALGSPGIGALYTKLPPGHVVLLRIQSERLELPAPFGGRVAKPLDPNATRQPTFDRCFDEVRCEEGQRDRHIDLTHATFLTCRNLVDVSVRARDDLIKPTTAAGDCTNEACAALDPRRTNRILRDAVRNKYLPGFPRGRLLPWDRQCATVRRIRRFLGVCWHPENR
jgi:hypothetical protein